MLTSHSAACAYLAAAIGNRLGKERVEGDTVFFDYMDGCFRLSGYAEIASELRAVLIRISPAFPVEAAYRPATMEFITRVNSSLSVGSWSLNLEDGDLRWKSGFFFGASGVHEECIDELIESSMTLVSDKLPGIVKVILGHSVDEALCAVRSE